MSKKRIGILTGGRDVPGLNSVIKSVVYRGAEIGCEVFGIRRGWEGLTHATDRHTATRLDCRSSLHGPTGDRGFVNRSRPRQVIMSSNEAKPMTARKDRERVIAEITLSHLIRLANEQGCPVNRQQAMAFLNREGRAFEMWKRMMQAGEEFIAVSLFQHSFSSEEHQGFGHRLWAKAVDLYHHTLAAFGFHGRQYSK